MAKFIKEISTINKLKRVQQGTRKKELPLDTDEIDRYGLAVNCWLVTYSRHQK